MKQLLFLTMLFLLPFLVFGQITINSPSDWSDIINDYGLDEGELYDAEIYVNANLTIGVDYQFYGCHFTFADNVYLLLSNGKEIIMDMSQSNISSLISFGGKWGGIVIQNKNTLRMSNTILENAKIGMDALPISSIYLNDNLIESCGIGLRTNGFVNLYELNNNVFGASQKGIQINNSEILMNIAPITGEGNTFENIDSIAIESLHSSTNIRNNSFENCLNAIIMEDNTASRIKYNYFNGFKMGIISNNGFNTVISNNDLHSYLTDGTGGLAIRVDNSFYTRIYKNQIEQLYYYGIVVSNNDKIYIENNEIDGVSLFYNAVAGISSSFNKSIVISQNVINNDNENSDLLGIYVNECFPLSIDNNEIYFSGTRTEYNAVPSFGILVLATNSANVKNNIIDGDFEVGIELGGSPGAKIKCNEIETTKNGIILHSLSNAQYIRANILDNEEYDIWISNEIGQQNHLGNKFLGGNAMAVNMSDIEIFSSKFFVNSNESYHFPINPNPVNGWFDEENSIIDKSCYDITIPPTIPPTIPTEPDTSRGFYDDPIAVLKFIEHIEALPIGSPKRFIQSFHLQSFYQNDNVLEMPESILFGEINEEIGSFDALLDINKNLFYPSELVQSDVNSISQSSELLDQLIDQSAEVISLEQEEGLLTDINNQLQLIKTDRNDWQETKILNLNQIEASLANLESDNELTYVWKMGMTLVTKYKKQMPFTSVDLENLDLISHLCIAEFGDPVYWARAILDGVAAQYIEYGDECIKERSLERSKGLNNEINASFYPNPTNGIVKLQQDINDILYIEVSNTMGEIMWKKMDIKNNTLSIDLISGIYIMNIYLKNGDQSSNKLIIQK